MVVQVSYIMSFIVHNLHYLGFIALKINPDDDQVITTLALYCKFQKSLSYKFGSEV